MTGDLAPVLDALDLAVARAAAVLDDDELEPAARAVQAVRQRRGYVGGTLVLALAGGTGSGKSSLLNALAGSPVASVSPIRPHTDQPLAWYPADAEPALQTLFERYGISRRVPQHELPGLALVDLPDHDSVVGEHRATVEALLPEVDGVIWVLDPEKYRDPVLHDDILGPLTDYQDLFLFVLNQVDRLAGDAGDVSADVRAALTATGIEAPELFLAAADPEHGPPAGIDVLRRYLAERLDSKRMGLGKLLTDIRRAGDELAAAAGIAGGGSLEFDQRWDDVRRQAAGALAADGAAGRHDTACRIEDFVAALSVETGGAFGRELRAAFPLPWLEEKVDAACDAWLAAPPPPPPRRRFYHLRRAKAPPRPPADLAARLDRGVGGPLRERLFARALLGATLASFRVELATVEARVGLAERRQGE